MAFSWPGDVVAGLPRARRARDARADRNELLDVLESSGAVEPRGSLHGLETGGGRQQDERESSGGVAHMSFFAATEGAEGITHGGAEKRRKPQHRSENATRSAIPDP